MCVCAVRLACCVAGRVFALHIGGVCNNQSVWLNVGGILESTESCQLVCD